MTAKMAIIGVFGVLACLNFIVANIFGYQMVLDGIIASKEYDDWYFLSEGVAFVATLFVVREYFKGSSIVLYIIFDLFLNFAALSLITVVFSNYTEYNIPQFIAAGLSLLISIIWFLKEWRKKKQLKK